MTDLPGTCGGKVTDALRWAARLGLICGQEQHTLICTLDPGHSGDHSAKVIDQVMVSWPACG